MPSFIKNISAITRNILEMTRKILSINEQIPSGLGNARNWLGKCYE